jgi:hypothetical protein
MNNTNRALDVLTKFLAVAIQTITLLKLLHMI